SHIPVFMFFSSRHSYHLDLHSFPTRRSSDLKDTYATLHMWTQIVGKVRLALTPRLNHWWNVPLYVSARGLTTTAIPYAHFTFEQIGKHTSELQSPYDLVCRLLLEKKKKKKKK